MRKILVTYASKAGSTGEIAAAIAEVLCDSGTAVDVRPVGEVYDLSGYQAAVLGSAVRKGSWLRDAISFVKTHHTTLARIPVAYFQVCATLKVDTEESRRTAETYLGPMRALIEPASVGLFAGKVDFDKLSWLDRNISKMVGSVEGDWRDWEAIRAWAGGLRPALGIA